MTRYQSIFNEAFEAGRHSARSSVDSDTTNSVHDRLKHAAQAADLAGKQVVFNCGRLITVVDGKIKTESGVQHGRDGGPINDAISASGEFKRIDAIDMREFLFQSGRTLTVREVCLVYVNTNPDDPQVSLNLLPEGAETYAPIVNIASLPTFS